MPPACPLGNSNDALTPLRRS